MAEKSTDAVEEFQQLEEMVSVPQMPCRNMHRLKRDMMEMYREPPFGLFAVPDSRNLMIMHAVIVGPKDTPYDGGLFYFVMTCPPDYPFKPPKVTFMTTDAGKVRFNPNLYADGKVCLSILGTWTGPSWCAGQTLVSTLLSMQASVLNEKPYHNEPGYEGKEMEAGDAALYNQVVQHETLRVAVCGMLENETNLSIPKTIKAFMWKTFRENFDAYIATAKEKSSMDGKKFMDPFGNNTGTYQYKNILRRLEVLKLVK